MAKKTEVEKKENTDHKRTSRGLIEELEELAYNIMALVDHILDLPDEKLPDMLEYIDILNNMRQEIIATYAQSDQIDYHYHCQYKHAIKALGLFKEAILAARRGKYYRVLETLLSHFKEMQKILNSILYKYLNIDIQGFEEAVCARCLDDVILDKTQIYAYIETDDGKTEKVKIENLQIKKANEGSE